MTNSLPKIIITGGKGQLAMAIQQHVYASRFHLLPYSHTELDITDLAALTTALHRDKPTLVINTAAYTAVDAAENDFERAYAINHRGAETIAIACKQFHIPLIHLSTDYVFDGHQHLPYTEECPPNPINVYGKSKRLGEEAIRTQHDQHIILRVSGIFSEYGQNFYKTIKRLEHEKPALRVVADQITCPTHADDIAGALLTIAMRPTRFGTYHFCSAPPISWYEFAKNIVSNPNQVQPISTHDYPTAAKRPSYSVLNCNKIKRDYNLTQPTWQTHLEKIS